MIRRLLARLFRRDPRIVAYSISADNGTSYIKRSWVAGPNDTWHQVKSIRYPRMKRYD